MAMLVITRWYIKACENCLPLLVESPKISWLTVQWPPTGAMTRAPGESHPRPSHHVLDPQATPLKCRRLYGGLGIGPLNSWIYPLVI